MDLDVAVATLPYRRIAAQPFVLEWEMAYDDGSPTGAPEDISDVTGVRATAEQIVGRGVTPIAPKVWTLTSGVSFYTDTDTATPVLQIAEAAGLDPGRYLLKIALTRGGGAIDWFLEATLDLVEQP